MFLKENGVEWGRAITFVVRKLFQTMTFELLESVRLYIGQKVRLDRIAANNSRLNGYKSVALDHENEAVFGENILRDLAGETVCRTSRARRKPTSM
jgi:hypothetical protein